MMFREDDLGFADAAPAPALPRTPTCEPASIWRPISTVYSGPAGAHSHSLDIAEETPLAIAYNGIAYAVMMGTPRDLDDFALGFSVAEAVAVGAHDLKAVNTAERGDGIAVDITLAPDALHRFLARRRLRALRGNTSCGLCGIEDLAQLSSAAPATVRPARAIPHMALHRATENLRGLQPLSERTHCAHAAAWANLTGALVLVREDVGRHNALDKLVGAAMRGQIGFADGFCLVTSRCSYEMAQKAIAAGISMLVAISAPTALAIRTAQAAGLALITRDRADGFLVHASPGGAPVLT